MEFKQGKIIGFSNRNPIAWIIKLLTKSKWSHTGIIYSVEDKKVIIAEAVSDGFRLIEHSKKELQKKLKKNKIKLRDIPDPHCSPTLIIRNYLRVKYGYFIIALNAISILFKKKLKGDKDKTLICSEAVAVIANKMTSGRIDIAKEFGVTQDFVTPEMIMESTQLIDC